MRVFAKNNSIFKLLSKAVSEGLLVVNRDRVIVATNKRVDKMFGYRCEELIDQPLNIFIPDSYKIGTISMLMYTIKFISPENGNTFAVELPIGEIPNN